jgi:DNA-binding NarL/FixJ family response regulator
MTTRIAITDDHEMVLKGIETMLLDTKEISVVGTYKDANETLENIAKDDPDVLLLDINLPDINGIDLCKQLLKNNPILKIIALTNFDETSFVKRILTNGAQGYLLKNTDKNELLEAIKTVVSGEQYLQRDIQKKLLFQAVGKTTNSTLLIKLTRREKEVLQAISEELTTKEISEKLFISPKTVETHRMNLMSKLGAKNSVGIIKIAIEKQLL